MRPEIVEIFRDLSGQLMVYQLRCHPDRIGDPTGVGTAMALDDKAIQTEQHAAIMVVRVEMVAKQFRRRPRNQESKLGTQRTGKGALEQVGDEASSTLGSLERYLPEKPSVTTTSASPREILSPSI